MRIISEIIVHCSATKEGANFKAADIDRWHREKGWNGIGYHYVVDLDGKIELGRPLDQVGAHCTNHNSRTIGICYIGGLDQSGKAKDTRNEAQRKSLVKLVKALKVCFPTIVKVSGHRDYAARDCPCFDARKEYGGLVE